MGTRKKSAELVFTLEWRNKPDNGGDKSNVIGMYDTPTTTLNFDMFKSYLLKNSGVAGNDVKVTYVTDSGQEWVIDSQEWFEIALSAFRLKARLGEVIFLKLDRISNGRHQMTRKHSNDVETQFDVDSLSNNESTPPEWFVTYMKQFKRDIVEEVTFAVSSNISPNPKEKESVPVTATSSRKIKPDSSKRSRKHLVLGEIPIDKEFLKTLKYDRKLESKLDKLDAKTKKIKEKKQALINKIENEEHRIFNKKVVPIETEVSSSKAVPEERKAEECKPVSNDVDNSSYTSSSTLPLKIQTSDHLNGTATNAATYQRLMGGEVFLQTWELLNDGPISWSKNIELRLTWGSANLVPSNNKLYCPPLKPGEKEHVAVRFQIPEAPGTYESYWNFYDGKIRFGRTLGCCFVVEEPLQLLGQPMLFKNASFIQNSEEENVQECESLWKSSISVEETIPECFKNSEKPLIILKEGENGKRLVANTPPVIPKMDKIVATMKPFDIKRMKFLTPEIEVLDDENNDKNNRIPYEPVDPSSMFGRVLIDESFVVCPAEDLPDPATAVIDLSKRMEDVKIAEPSNVDPDSDWESLNSFEKLKASYKKYGISEKDLIVDLSMNTKEKTENNDISAEVKESTNTIENEDNNNNGLFLDDSSAGSASEFTGSVYDVLDIPECDEKEDSSGYVYITIDGNKLPVPRHILCPDFLLTAEEAPGPMFSDEEKSIEKKVVSKDASIEQVKTVENIEQKTCESQSLQDSNVLDGSQITSDSTNGNLMSESTSNRLFIFPQNNPGFEVFCSAHPACSSIKDESNEPSQTYTWATSPTQYTLSDVHNIKRTNPVHLKSNPYGPLESRSPTCGERHSSLNSEHSHCQGATSPPTCPFATCPSAGQYAQYSHVPNYQQAGTNPLMYPQMPETASAPPQQKSPDHNVPVHILPENLVSGAVNVASSAINTARSVINMIVPPRTEPGKWVNGHWITENPESLRAKNLIILTEMGFWDTDLNATLLARYNDDINRVINELIQ